MSFRVVRSSKFRHVYGTGLKREQCYDNIRVSKSSWDSTFCAVNPKFLAIIVESAGGGAFIVLPLNKIGRINPDYPLVGGHKGPVLDIAWCPHNDNVIASGSEDCYVKIWQIPDYGLSRTLTESVVDLVYHQRRVGLVLWHPSAHNILLTAGSDNQVVIWNVGTAETLVEIDCHPDLVYSACWNWNGSQIVTTCRDKKIRLINPRNGQVEEEALCHEGSKGSRAIFLRNGLVFTTGFSKMSERQYSLRAPEHLDEPIVMVELDTSNGVMFPLYDADTNLVYLCGKGDSVIRYFEITAEPPFVHYINTFQTPDPQRGIGLMPKRGSDTTCCEISRFFRLNNSGFCQVISMTVPRKSELFQEDLYPDTPGDNPAITAEEWMEGADAEPILISLKDGYRESTKKNELKVKKKPNLLDKRSSKLAVSGSGGSGGGGDQSDQAEEEMASPQQLNVPMKVIEDMQDEIRKLKAMIVKHEKRIRALESQTAGNGVVHEKEKEKSAEEVPPLPLSEPPPPSITINNNSHPNEMAPDEV